ncbi:hypothetical protein [uncultured Castellaniella sp.]|mgnify:CR=1 FL=1|uniref:hypothetical protein n=1 Tax=uncultured Castellaniella sp. TaxID=647907 RepID=UPI00260877E2|nr:hypothetical protein [uncultured Castellaniella sp.]
MDRQKKFLAIGGATALILAGVWVTASSVATRRAEDKLYGLLDQYKLRDAVHWQDLSASPLGSATLKDVTIRFGSAKNPEQIAIERVTLSDLEDSADRKTARVEISGIAGAGGFSPLAQVGVIQAAGRTDLPPFSLALAWDLDGRADTGSLQLSLDQPEAFKGDFNVNMSRLRELLRFTDRLADSKAEEIPKMLGGFGFFGPWGVLMAIGQKVQQVEVGSITASVKNDGYVTRSRALALRHDVDVAPGQGSAEKQRKKWLEDKIDAGKEQCKRDPEGAFDGAPLRREDCLALLDFVTGGSSKLSMTMEPARPVSLEQLFDGGGRRDSYRPLRLLEMKLSN